jgi:hypothetical protein
VGSGTLKIVFVATSEVPGQITKRVCQVLEGFPRFRVVQMLMRPRRRPRCPARPPTHTQSCASPRPTWPRSRI